MTPVDAVELHSTACAICGVYDESVEVYPARFTAADFNPSIFSARRQPDRVHYRMVRCRRCGLLRSDPVADTAAIAALYRESAFDYGPETENLRRTYGRYLRKAPGRGTFLEIGCGNGFFLEEARALGFSHVTGIEPSAEAVRQAAPGIRNQILCDLMRPGLLPPSSIDVIAMFQVFDHLPDPGAVLDECRRLLRPGGWVLCLNHDAGAFSARVLGECSPIIDIEHTYLYDRRTLARIFAAHGLEPRRSGAVSNCYSLQYLARLLPLPRTAKQAVLNFLSSTRLGNVNIRARLGNLYLMAQKASQ
ncbi:MAG: class I SAM-dependent methyltransferase [Bryobacteraceae bacterium]